MFTHIVVQITFECPCKISTDISNNSTCVNAYSCHLNDNLIVGWLLEVS